MSASPQELSDLASILSAAEQHELRTAPSLVSSATSEERDNLHEASEVQHITEISSVRSDKTASVHSSRVSAHSGGASGLSDPQASSKNQVENHSRIGTRSPGIASMSGANTLLSSHKASGPKSESGSQSGSNQSDPGVSTAAAIHKAAIKSTMTEAQLHLVDKTISEIREQETQKMALLEASVQQCRAEIASEDDALWEEKQEARSLRNDLLAVRAEMFDAVDNKDDLEVKIAGLRAGIESAMKEGRTLVYEEQRTTLKEYELEIDKKEQAVRMEKHVREKQEELEVVADIAAKMEMDMQKDAAADLIARQKEEDKEMVKAKLSVANQPELIVKEAIIAKVSTPDVLAVSKTKKELAKDEMLSRKESTLKMEYELTANRLQLLKTQEIPPKMDKMQIQRVEAPRSAFNRKAFKVKSKMNTTSSLTAISEEDRLSDVQSVDTGSFSGNVSAQGEEEGGLQDFEDTSVKDSMLSNAYQAADLHLQLEEAKRLNFTLESKIAQLNAERDAQVDRLLNKLSFYRAERTEKISQGKVAEFFEKSVPTKEEASGAQYNYTEESDDIYEMCHAEISQEVFKLRDQVNSLREANRALSQRLHDTKDALRNESRKVDGLQAKICLLEASNTSSSTPAGQQLAIKELADKLTEAEVEKNCLKNELEVLGVQLNGHLDMEKMQHELARNSLQKVEEELRHEREITSTLRQQVSCQYSVHSEHRPPELREKNAQKQSAFIGIVGRAVRSLKCPTRSEGTDIDELVLGKVVWNLLRTLRGVIAVNCNSENWKITEATAAAHELWGTLALIGPGGTFLSLISENLLAHEYLKAELKKRRVMSRGQLSEMTWLWDLSVFEVKHKQDKIFDASLYMAYFPSEQQGAGNYIAIFEPLRSLGGGHRLNTLGSSASGGRGVDTRSNLDIGPLDSVSNILARSDVSGSFHVT